MEITKSTRIAYAEIDSFIELLPKEEKEKRIDEVLEIVELTGKKED